MENQQQQLKTASFSIKLEPDLLQAFREAIRKNQHNASLVIRDFMCEYVENSKKS